MDIYVSCVRTVLHVSLVSLALHVHVCVCMCVCVHAVFSGLRLSVIFIVSKQVPPRLQTLSPHLFLGHSQLVEMTVTGSPVAHWWPSVIQLG